MKNNIIISSILSIVLYAGITSVAQAHEEFRVHRCCYSTGANFLAPALIGGVIGYELARPNTVYVEPSVVYAQPPVTMVQQPPVGYHWQQMMNPQTGQLQTVLVPN
jgi:hypothetical protein